MVRGPGRRGASSRAASPGCAIPPSSRSTRPGRRRACRSTSSAGSTPAEGADPETVADEVEGYVSGLLTMVGIEADPLAGKEHPALQPHPQCLVIRAGHRPRRPGRPGAGPASASSGSTSSTLLPGQGAFEAGDHAERTARLAQLRRLGRGAGHRSRPPPPCAGRRPTGMRHRCSIPPVGSGAPVRRLPAARQADHLDAAAARTDRLRVLYFDEVMGFVPPTAMPPAKKPILTLFKTARAFGVGMVLATKPGRRRLRGLANAGTWMIGRLRPSRTRPGCSMACRPPVAPSTSRTSAT